MAEKTIDRCPHCNKFTWRGAEFCHECGGTLHPRPNAVIDTATPTQAGNVCKACGTPLKPGFKFCGGCGEPVPEKPSPSDFILCCNCGVDLKKGDRFCQDCGHEVVAERPPEKACPKCGELWAPDMVFCAKCGIRIPSGDNNDKLTERTTPKRQAIETGVEGVESVITAAIASPKIIAIVAAILLIISCFVPWLSISMMGGFFSFGESLPAYLIVANVFLAMISLMIASQRRPIWGLFLLMGLMVFAIEFVYLYGAQEMDGFSWDMTLTYLNNISTGFVLHLIAGVLLFVNIYFARLRMQIEFERYIKSHSHWQY